MGYGVSNIVLFITEGRTFIKNYLLFRRVLSILNSLQATEICKLCSTTCPHINTINSIQNNSCKFDDLGRYFFKLKLIEIVFICKKDKYFEIRP